MSTRQPVVAGQFYPADKVKLKTYIQHVTKNPSKPPAPAKGCILPHAGYVYSGGVAGATLATLKLPQRIVILCPNHTGLGTPLSILSQGSWRTPLGESRVDTELAEALKKQFPLLQEDGMAHEQEHAIEVQLPFFQVLVQDFTFVPIVVGTAQVEVLSALGVVLAKVLSALAPEALIVASSDMNHYESDEVTRRKDAMALEKILLLAPEELLHVTQKEGITMCGVAPAAVMLTAAKRLGATHAELIQYATSGDAFNDRARVVGYAGVTVA
jgi:hypothetical protein